MNHPPLDKLTEVRSYFENGDTHVGYRRLLDAAIETQDSEVFEHTLTFCDWYDTYGNTNNAVLNEKVNALLEKIGKHSYTPASNDLQPKIKVESLGKTYNKGNFRLGTLNFDLMPGKIIGLVGENGNGKTTLLRLLYGELMPDSGTISYNLQQIPANSNFYDIKTRLAFIPQRPNPWYGSLMDNLQFTSTHYGFKGRDNFLWTEMICARMGLREFRTYTWSRISSGYKMRFELAKTLIKKPEVLLLDEPLANLDILAQQVILEDLKFLAQSQKFPLGIILSSQQLYEVEKVSSEVIFLKNGQPRYQQTNKENTETTPSQFIIELDTTANRDVLQQTFAHMGLQNISFNGGVYIIYFNEHSSSSEIIRTLGENKIPVKYFRDISTSSRRFFDA